MPKMSYEKEVALAAEKENFFNILGESRIVNRHELNGLSDEIDYKVSLEIIKCISKHYELIFNHSRMTCAGINLTVDDIDYIISTDYQNNQLRKVFSISIIPCVKENTPPELVAIKKGISEKGKFSDVEIIYPKKILKIDEGFIFNIAISSFNIGYHWLNTSLVRTIEKSVENLNVEIYDFIHRMVQNPKILDGFIFSVLMKDRQKKEQDFVLLDGRSAHSLIDMAEKSDYLINFAPAKLVSDMMFDVIPANESVIIDVVKSGKKQDIDLVSTSKWSTNDLGKTLRVIWGDTVCCNPISNYDSFILVSFYPKQHHTVLDKTIKLHKKKIDHIAKNNLNKIEKSLSVLDTINGKDKVSYFAEITGTFFGHFFGLNVEK